MSAIFLFSWGDLGPKWLGREPGTMIFSISSKAVWGNFFKFLYRNSLILIWVCLRSLSRFWILVCCSALSLYNFSIFFSNLTLVLTFFLNWDSFALASILFYRSSLLNCFDESCTAPSIVALSLIEYCSKNLYCAGVARLYLGVVTAEAIGDLFW